MNSTIRAWAAQRTGGPLEPYEYDPGLLGAEEVEISVEHCGVCYSDLAFIGSEWSPTTYPIVPGHEVVGRITALGDNAKGLSIGQRVGVGWYAGSCTHCHPCIRGEQNLCAQRQPTIVGRHGGFADRLRAHWMWSIPLPEQLDPAVSGPLMCGGLTVFNPFLLNGVRPTDRVGVIGIGGLGHLALQFARAWGCEVTAFTSSAAKHDEAKALGAHRVVSSTDAGAMKKSAGSIDFLISTVRAPLDWGAVLETLAPKGRLHIVGVTTEPVPIIVRPHLIAWQRSISGSSTGSPGVLATMLGFVARHRIAPHVEHFPMSRVNDAIAHLRSGNARYRVVLDADFS